MATTPHSLPMSLFRDIDRAGPIPLYYQVARLLETAITDGTLPPGTRLENEIALGERLNISRPTIRRAIQELVDKGMLVRRRGIGTQVVHSGITRNVELTSLYEDLAQSNRKPTTTLLKHEVVEADAETAEGLAVDAGSPVLHIRRVRAAEGTPIAILENWLPEQFADIGESELTQLGLYTLLRGRGVTIRVARQRIGARNARPEEAELLDLDRHHGAVLTMERGAFDNSAKVVEMGRHVYRPDLYSFEVTLVDK